MPENNGGSTTIDLVEYYSNLLVSQYQGKPRAVATIQASVTPVIMPGTTVEEISFEPVPTGGTFTLRYGDVGEEVTINWNDSAATIQALLRGIAPDMISGGDATPVFAEILSGGDASTTTFNDLVDGGTAFGWDLTGIVVTGSIASRTLTVTFFGVQPPAALLEVVANSLTPSPVQVTVTETDLTMPLAVMNGFNLS